MIIAMPEKLDVSVSQSKRCGIWFELFPLVLAVTVAFIAETRTSASAQEKPVAPDESKEPALKYQLRVGDKSLTISEGETVSLAGAFSNPKVTLTAEEFRVFPYGGISFRYPRTFTFEADLDNRDSLNWTLSGNDYTIMYFVMNASVTTEDFAGNMSEQFGKENCMISKATPIKLDGSEIAGTSLIADLAGSQLAIDIYRLPSGDQQTRLFVLQDNPDDAGDRSMEGKAALNLLQQSFRMAR